jgi:hypothetical protein
MTTVRSREYRVVFQLFANWIFGKCGTMAYVGTIMVCFSSGFADSRLVSTARLP